MTLFFAWSDTNDIRTTLLATASFASLYWICQTLAILYPGTKYFDVDTKAVYMIGIPAQAWFGMFVFALVGLACLLAR